MKVRQKDCGWQNLESVANNHFELQSLLASSLGCIAHDDLPQPSGRPDLRLPFAMKNSLQRASEATRWSIITRLLLQLRADAVEQPLLDHRCIPKVFCGERI